MLSISVRPHQNNDMAAVGGRVRHFVKRWVFRPLAAISLLLAIVSASLWIESYYYLSLRGVQYGPRAVISQPARSGLLDLLIVTGGVDHGERRVIGGHFGSQSSGGTSQSTMVFEYRPFATNVSSGCTLIVPYWFITVLFLLLPVGWAVTRVWTKRRAVEGQCPTCGYDLRATPTRCPECGTGRAGAVD